MKECLYIPTLESDRLILRKLTAADADDLKEWLAREELYTYWGRSVTKGEKDPVCLFTDPRPNVKRPLSHDFIWGIELKSTHKVIGLLEVFDVENDRYGKLGYRVNPDLWNEGICTEALKRSMEFLFSETGFDRLEATAHVNNTASNKVLEKCGFLKEGTIRHGKMVREYCDYNIWGFIRDDFQTV